MKICFKLGQLKEIIKKYFFPLMDKHKIFTFTGPLGAGKTTVIKKILKIFGVEEVITSPTFTYLNIYETNFGKKIYHFDLYRLESLEDFLSLGFEEFLYDDNSFCFIEWPEILEPIFKGTILNKKVARIAINFDDSNFEKRVLDIK